MATGNGPAWGYRKDEAKIFEDGVLPEGWFDSPAKIKGAKPTHPSAEELAAEASNNAV